MKISEAKQVREGLYKAIFASLFAKPVVSDEQSCDFWCVDENQNLLCDKQNIIAAIQDEEKYSDDVCKMIDSYIDFYISSCKGFDAIIAKYLKGDFTIDKLAKTDLSVIYTAMCEIGYNKDLSEKIIVSEAVELAKKYSGENSYKFINGILRNIVKELRNE